MACISPSLVRKGASVFLAPCGHCSQCIASKVAEKTFLARKVMDSPLYRASGSSFVCLTYDNKTLPISPQGYATLSVDDLQRFFKRLRINAVRSGYNVPLKYIACGEYGSDVGRPHYHICLFGAAPALAESLVRMSWTDRHYGGLVDVKPLQLSGVGYVCKYLSKSHPKPALKAEYEKRGAIPPFVLQSQSLARDWIFNHAAQIVKDNFQFVDVKSGERRLYCSYVRDYVECITGVDPRPIVDEYMRNIDTHGMPLDDFNCERDYLHAREEYLKSIKNGTPAYQLTSCRLPVKMRSNHNTDYKLVALAANS